MAHLPAPATALLWSRTTVLAWEAFLGACEGWQAVSGDSELWWAKLERHGAGRGWEQDRFFASVTSDYCGWHLSLLFIASTLPTCTGTAPDTNTDSDRGGEMYSAAWMSMRFSHSVFCQRRRGHLLGFQSWAAHNTKASSIVHEQV